MKAAIDDFLIKMLEADFETKQIVFDNYRSVGNPEVLVFVPSQTVPPFRFKAGGWELVRASIDLGPAMKTRIAEKGFFMCRLVEGEVGWTELNDFAAFSQPSSA